MDDNNVYTVLFKFGGKFVKENRSTRGGGVGPRGHDSNFDDSKLLS